MDELRYLPAALILLAVAACAHWRIRDYTVAARVMPVRAILVVVGIAFGWIMVVATAVTGWAALWVFLSGFGLVHVPAAVVLGLKRWRREGRS